MTPGLVLHALSCGVLSLALVVAPSTPPAPQTARKLFDAGSLSYKRAHYSDASRAFEAAYQLLPKPEIAFSLAQAQRRQFFVDQQDARRLRAIELYRVYLRDSPDGARREEAVEQLQTLEALRPPQTEEATDERPPPLAPATELLIYSGVEGATASIDGGVFVPTPTIVTVAPGAHEIEMHARGYDTSSLTVRALPDRLIPVEFVLLGKPATLELHSNRPARVLVDGREVGRTPLASPISLTAGPHTLRVETPGRVPAQRIISLEGGQRQTLRVEMPRTHRRDAALAVLGTSAGLWVAGALTLGFTLRTQRRAQAAENLRGIENITASGLADYREDLRDRNRLRAATVGLWSLAAVTTTLGLILLRARRR